MTAKSMIEMGIATVHAMMTAAVRSAATTLALKSWTVVASTISNSSVSSIGFLDMIFFFREKKSHFFIFSFSHFVNCVCFPSQTIGGNSFNFFVSKISEIFTFIVLEKEKKIEYKIFF